MKLGYVFLGNSKFLRQTDGCASQFKSLFDIPQPFFVERAFRIFDRDGNGAVSMAEFIDTMHHFAGQTSDEKLVFLFKVYDLDGECF